MPVPSLRSSTRFCPGALSAPDPRCACFAWYNLVGSFATATGALCAGVIAQALQNAGWTALDAYRAVIVGYALMGGLLLLAFLCLSPAVEVPVAKETQPPKLFLGLHKSRGIVLKLRALFALDAFAGGFIVQSMVAFWFSVRFAADVDTIGAIFFAANILAGISALLAARDRGALWADQHNGLHAHSVQRAAHAGAADADPADSRFCHAAALFDLADGRADAAVLHDGGGGARRAVGRRGG